MHVSLNLEKSVYVTFIKKKQTTPTITDIKIYKCISTRTDEWLNIKRFMYIL